MTVSSQIIEVLNELCKKFGIVIDWSSENVMPYLKELCGRFIHYEIYTSVAWMVLTSVVCIVLWIIFAATFKKAKENQWYDEYCITWINMLSCIFAIGFSIASIIVIGMQVFDIIEAHYLPEKTIYDFVTYQIDIHK